MPPNSLISLKSALNVAERQGYAVGSFAPRYTPMIAPILRAGERARSPLIVQISQREMARYGIVAAEFSCERSTAKARPFRSCCISTTPSTCP
jgi:fructose/tagatose bisphosphate aldolase